LHGGEDVTKGVALYSALYYTKWIARVALSEAVADHPCGDGLVEALNVVARLADDRDQPMELRVEAASAIRDVIRSAFDQEE
jgi:hypothetical protein